MLIDIQLRQGTDINTVFALGRERIAQRVIEAVDTFDDQDIFLAQLQEIAVVFTFAGEEVIHRQLHPFSGKKIEHISVEKFDVDGFQTLIILFAVLIERCLGAIDKIVVHRNGMWLQAVCRELYRESVGERGLSR